MQVKGPFRTPTTAPIREQQIARTFVKLADTLVDDFDLLDFLYMLTENCVQLLEVSAAAVVLIDHGNSLRMAAASSERAELLELLAIQADEGPCIECVHSGQPVASPVLTENSRRWPKFVSAAQPAGFQAAHALPMRLRGQIIGALTLLNDEAGEIDGHIGQALADVATIGILQNRAIDRSELVAEQLQNALNSRVIIEQAKGILFAHKKNLDMEKVFAILRGYARTNNQRLVELARTIAEGRADIDAILDHSIKG